MRWIFDSREPLTTESRRLVRDKNNRTGWIGIRHEGGRPQTYGGVHDDDGKLLDKAPTLVSDTRRLLEE